MLAEILRLAAAIFGYALRHFPAPGFLSVIRPACRKRRFLWIPAALNALFCLTALFTPLTLYFDRNDVYRRGPFGLTVSSGLALKEDTNGTLEEMIQVSDKRMYEEKRSYYQQHDRRKRS